MSRELAVSQLEFARSVSQMILNGFGEEQLCHQRSACDNHPLWVMGHIACTDVWMAGVMGAPGVTVPEAYSKLFGMGSKPCSNPKEYPPAAEVRKYFDDTRAALLAWYRAATPEQLALPLKEKTGGFAENPIDAAFKNAWHEGWHFGQAATVRKDLGLPSVF